MEKKDNSLSIKTEKENKNYRNFNIIPKYRASELLEGYSAFKVPKEVVETVIKIYKVTEATEADFNTLVQKFINSKVGK